MFMILGLGLWIEDWDLEIGIWDRGLKLRIGDWDSRLGLGILTRIIGSWMLVFGY